MILLSDKNTSQPRRSTSSQKIDWSAPNYLSRVRTMMEPDFRCTLQYEAIVFRRRLKNLNLCLHLSLNFPTHCSNFVWLQLGTWTNFRAPCNGQSEAIRIWRKQSPRRQRWWSTFSNPIHRSITRRRSHQTLKFSSWNRYRRRMDRHLPYQRELSPLCNLQRQRQYH